MAPTKFVDLMREDRLGCVRSIAWFVAFEAAICIAVPCGLAFAVVHLKRKEDTMKTAVAVSYREMALLQDYSIKTGIPIDRCVSEALSDWLAYVAPATLEALDLPPLNPSRKKWGIRLVRSRSAVK
jgi:hypothetical protein